MQYVAFVFGVFGLMAFLELSELKGKITKIERALSEMKGTPYAEEKEDLERTVRSYIGESVVLELKEDHEDTDIISYGNTKSGSNTILDTDGTWMLVRIESARGVKEKLVRLESIGRISRKN